VTAPIVTRFRTPVHPQLLPILVEQALVHLSRGIKSLTPGQLWERVSEVADLAARTCPECKDSVPPGWTLDDHFNCNYPEDLDSWIPGDCPVHSASCDGQHP
jgi:hypothetical protein